MTKDKDLPLIGHLIIYVDGYKVHREDTAIASPETDWTFIPDRLIPASCNDVGSNTWWHEGWAVGDNSRDRLCKRLGAKSLKQFKDYDDAVSFIYHRQRKFKQHQHILVYVSRTLGDKEMLDVVRSLDDIYLVDAKRTQEIEAQAAWRVEQGASYPCLAALTELYGPMKAMRLADLLRCVRAGTPEKTMVPLAKATRYRLMKNLREAGFLD